MTWQEWCSATLAGIKAPDSPTNHASLTGQMTHEKGYAGGWAQWCNPLNTTQKWNGSVDSGAQPGLHDVQIYRSLADGVAATVYTLLTPVPGVLPNGYDAIVGALRQSRPTVWWESASRTQLDTWGTGQSWLNSVPLTGDVMALIDDVYSVLVHGTTVAGSSSFLSGLAKAADIAANTKALSDLTAAIKAIPAPVPAPAPAPILTAQEAADLHTIAEVFRKFGVA